MDIPNLSPLDTSTVKSNKNSKIIIAIIVVFGITAGFWISRFWPTKTAVSLSELEDNTATKIVDSTSLKVGVLYGDTDQSFKDSATGTIAEGNVKGEGTHILKREGGDSQTVALTSSTVDLNLFVGKKVEVTGQTNSSNKAAWLLDVGNIKIIE